MKNEIVNRQTNSLTVSQNFLQEWQVMKEQATILIKSGFLPTAVNTPEKAIAIMMKGKEVGMQPMQALSQINVIQGKPGLSAEGMLALVLKNYPGTKIDYLNNDNESCVIEVTKPGDKGQIWSFTLEDAKKAELLGKDMWRKYPRSMLRSRCISEMCRGMFPDAIQGCSYTPEELEHIEPMQKVKPLDISFHAQNTKEIDASPQEQTKPEQSNIFNKDDMYHINTANKFLVDEERHLLTRVTEIMHGKEITRTLIKEAIMLAKKEEIVKEHPDLEVEK